MRTSLGYPYYTFAYQRRISGKSIFVYQRTVAYFMQIMRPATDVAYELRFYDVPVAYLFGIHGLCVAYMLRCCDKSFLCVTYLYCVSLWP